MKPTQLSHLKIAVAVATILLAATACGGSPDDAAATDQTLTVPQDGTLPDGTLQQGVPGGRGFPGASGKIAAVDGTTLQVQSAMDGQVAVTYDGDTEFTEQVETDLSALEVGDCVMVMGQVGDQGDDQGDDQGGGALDASTVMIAPAGEDGCVPNRPEGAPNAAPEMQGGMSQFGGDAPPQGELPGGAAMMLGAFGEVTAVSATGFTVEATLPGSEESSSQQVTTSADTTWQATVATTSKAVKAGRCATALGERDDTGAVTATSIAISEAVDGQCMPEGLGGMGGMIRMEAAG